MDVSMVIIFLGALIFGAHFFNAIFDLTKIPNVLLLLLIGIVVGPIMGWVKVTHFGSVGPIFSTLTLIILLFESGVNLKIKMVVQSIRTTFLITMFNFIFSAVAATIIAHIFTSLDWIAAAFFGTIVAGTSSAVVIPMIKQLKINEKGSTILLLESALSDVLCLVIGLALLSSMKAGIISFKEISKTVLFSFLIAMFIGLVGGILWSLLLQRIRQMQFSSFTTLAFVFILYGVTDYLGYNGGIATLLFGMTLGNAYLFEKTAFRKIIPSKELLASEKSFFNELVFILQTYFFVYVGICIQFGSSSVYILALVIILIIVLARPLSIRLFIKRKEMPLKDLSIISTMMPKGLVPAILGSLPLQMGLLGGKVIQDLSYALVLESIVLCSLLVVILSKNANSISYFSSLLAAKAKDETEVITSQQTEEDATNEKTDAVQKEES